MSDTLRICPKCGGPIPAEAPQGLCPKCVLQQAATGTEAGQTNASKPVPPSLEELTAAFPQLQIIELVGQGGMGFVFKARQPKLDRFVAVKILPQTLALDPAFAERFQREARVLAKLNHPNIVTIFDFGQAGGFFFLLMEYVDGVNLREAMRLGRFTPAQALDIVPKICDALHFAHNEGILHRDIKPENILLDSRGRVKIADFGIAKILGTESVGETKVAASQQQNVTGVVGTPNYMAPEQLASPSKVDQRADIYSLGVVFYEMLTGELPGGSVVPPSSKSPVDARIDEIVMRTLEKERERRQKTADEVKTQVQTVVDSPSRKSEKSFWANGQYNFRSKQKLLGIPLVHVAWGLNPETKKPHVAKGVVAVGPVAAGLIAVGIEAYGLFAGGALAMGVAPVGLMALGLAAVGLLSVGVTASGMATIGRWETGMIHMHSTLLFLLTVIGILAARRILRSIVQDAFVAAQPGKPEQEAPQTATDVTVDRFAKIVSIMLATAAALVIVFVAANMVVRSFAPPSIPTGVRSVHGPTAPKAPTAPRESGYRFATPKSSAVFGPVHDEVVQARETKTNCFLDLDSGTLLTPSAPVVEAIEKNGATPERTWETRDIHGEGVRAYRYVQWIRETGADLLYMGNGRVVAFDCLLTPAHGESSTNWEDINSVRPEQWQRTIASLRWAQAVREAKRNQSPVPKPPKEAGIANSAVQLESETPNGPIVNELTLDQSRLWHFKTKRGAEGILDIVGFTNNPASVQIRYKLLQSGKRSGEVNHDLKKVTFGQPQLQVSSNGCLVLSIATETPMAPEEHLFSVLDFAPNGVMRHVKFTEQTNSTPAGPKTVHVLTWTFGGNLDAGFGQREADLAMEQLRQNGNRSYTMAAGLELPMFSVTNASGQILNGYLNYHHHFGEAVPTTEKVAPVMALNPVTR